MVEWNGAERCVKVNQSGTTDERERNVSGPSYERELNGPGPVERFIGYFDGWRYCIYMSRLLFLHAATNLRPTPPQKGGGGVDVHMPCM